MPLRRRRPVEPAPSPGPQVDLAVLAPEWRPPVALALDARARFHRIVERVQPGPVRDRLTTLADRVDAGVVAAHRLALRVEASQATLADLRPGALTARVKAARRSLAAAREVGADVAAATAELDALLAQHAAAMRVWDAVDDGRARLDALNARLEAAVVQAAVVATSGSLDDPALGVVEADLAAAGDELSALGSALDALP